MHWSERFESKDEAVRKTALNDLKALNHDERRQAAVILGSMLHRGHDPAEHAAWGLTALGAEAEPALPDLMYALSYDEESVAVAVSSAVIPMGAHAVGPLKRMLDDSNFFIRRRSAEILGKLGANAASATGALLERLADPQYEVQVAAEHALILIGPAAIPELMKTYYKDDEGARRSVVKLLGNFGPPAASPLAEVAKKDASGFVRLSAIEALAQLNPFPKEALPAMINGLYDLDEGVRGGSADALSSLGATANPAIPVLKRLSAGDPDTLVRQKMSDALTAITPPEPAKK